jgi:hypothetical protein
MCTLPLLAEETLGLQPRTTAPRSRRGKTIGCANPLDFHCGPDEALAMFEAQGDLTRQLDARTAHTPTDLETAAGRCCPERLAGARCPDPEFAWGDAAVGLGEGRGDNQSGLAGDVDVEGVEATGPGGGDLLGEQVFV